MQRLDETTLQRILEILLTTLENTTVEIGEIPPHAQQSGQPLQSGQVVTTNPVTLALSDITDDMRYTYNPDNNKLTITTYIAYNACGATVNIVYDVNTGTLNPPNGAILYEKVWQKNTKVLIPKYRVFFYFPSLKLVLQELFPRGTITSQQQLFLETLEEIDKSLKAQNYPKDANIISTAIENAMKLTNIPRDYFWMFLHMVIYEGGLPESVLKTIKLQFSTLLETIRESKLILSISPEGIVKILDKSIKALWNIVDNPDNKDVILKVVKLGTISEMIPLRLSGPVRVADLKNYVEELLKVHALLLALPEKLRAHLNGIGNNIKTIINEIKQKLSIDEKGAENLYKTVVNSLKNVDLSKINKIVSNPPFAPLLTKIDFSALFPTTSAEIFEALHAIHNEGAFKKLVDVIASEPHLEAVEELKNLNIYLSRLSTPGYIEGIKVELENKTAASQLKEIRIVMLYNQPCSTINKDIVTTVLQRTGDVEIIFPNSYFRISNLWAIGERPYEREDEEGKSQSYRYRVNTAKILAFHIKQGLYPGEFVLSYVKDDEFVRGDYTYVDEILEVLPDLQYKYYVGISSTSEFPYKKVDSEYELLSLVRSVAGNISTIVFIPQEYILEQQETAPHNKKLKMFSELSELGAAYLSMLAEKAEYIYKNKGIVDYNILKEHLSEFLNGLKLNNAGKRDPFLLQKIGKDGLIILIRDILTELADQFYRKYAETDPDYAVDLAMYTRGLAFKPIHVYLLKDEEVKDVPYVIRIVIEVTGEKTDDIIIDIPVTAVKKDYLPTYDNYGTAISNLIKTFETTLLESIDERGAQSSQVGSESTKPFSLRQFEGVENTDIQLVISLLRDVENKLIEVLQGKLARGEKGKKPIKLGVALPYIILTVNLVGGKQVVAKVLITKELVNRFKKYKLYQTPSPEGLRKANEILLDICKDFEEAIEYYASLPADKQTFTIENISNALGKDYHAYIVSLLQEAISKAFPTSSSKGVLLSQEEFDEIVRDIEKKVEEKSSKISNQNQKKIEEVLDKVIAQAIDKKILDLASYFLKERR